MANDVKSGVGFIIPALGIVGFFTSLLLGEFLLSIIIAVMVILVWFIYMLVMESHIPGEMGNMIILFGIMLSLGIFFGFGIMQNMWGGYDLKPEGAIFSLIILFFSVLTGLNFRNQQKAIQKEVTSTSGLSNEDRSLVMDAIKQNSQSNDTVLSSEPKVIIVKQEQPITENKLENKEIYPNQLPPQNPYFAYPADYYEDEYELDDEDEWEDDDEWEEED
ncbi:MAG: hypothetical protein HOI03_06475 [Candidatus Marinimicrobia bacterium]|jgi:hypothetical protein|nr:hypothetical protein [Candidatus Neomarinimicrobiota bacterium]